MPHIGIEISTGGHKMVEEKLIKNFRLVRFVYFFMAMLFVMCSDVSPASAEQSGAPLSAGTIGPIKADLFHVQGIALATDTIFITSVSKKDSAALLWKIDRATLDVIAVKNLAEYFMFHPSGLQFDGEWLWLAIAAYSENSSAKVLKVDPATLKVKSSFKVADHIGLVISDGRGTVIGANWDAKKFYFWNEKGKLSKTLDNPTAHGYQDCKLRGPQLVCSGGGFVDFINLETWEVEKSFSPGTTPGGNDYTREGMDFTGGKFYFDPDDGAGTFIYTLDPPQQSPDDVK
jgi:hypothetical protein